MLLESSLECEGRGWEIVLCCRQMWLTPRNSHSVLLLCQISTNSRSTGLRPAQLILHASMDRLNLSRHVQVCFSSSSLDMWLPIILFKALATRLSTHSFALGPLSYPGSHGSYSGTRRHTICIIAKSKTTIELLAILSPEPPVPGISGSSWTDP